MIDLSSVNYVLPLASFIFIFVLMFALLVKTKVLGENAFSNAIISFIIAVIFISISGVRELLELMLPWFSVIIVVIVIAVLLVTFVMKKPEDILKPGLAWAVMGIIAVVFIYLWFTKFNISHTYDWRLFKNWIEHKDVYGSIILGIVALIVGVMLVKTK
jgi:hypothetical protein